MLTKIDTTALDAKKKGLPFAEDLEQFVDDVALVKPKCRFVLDNDCVRSIYKLNETTKQYDHYDAYHKVKVYEGGEELGSVGTSEEYRCGKKELVYGVESFRINKLRGGNMTTSIHKKVALRHAKKGLVARAKDELANQIRNMVSERVKSALGSIDNQVSWSTRQNEIARDFALASYHARINGEGIVTLQANSSVYISNIKLTDQVCEQYYEVKAVSDELEAKLGYGVQAYTDGSYAILDFKTDEVIKYSAFDQIPKDMGEKLAMFKVIQQGEYYSHLGVKLLDHVFYIVDGKTKVKQ